MFPRDSFRATTSPPGGKPRSAGTAFFPEKPPAATLRDIFSKPVLIFGCGNVLFGDDGFGPEVIDHLLRHCPLPSHVAACDAGTSIREILFDLVLMKTRPRLLFIVDAVYDRRGEPGEIFELDAGRIAPGKESDFSLHQFPSVNLLHELRDGAGATVRVLCVRALSIPGEVGPGLSNPVRAAVPAACQWLLRQIEETP